MRKFEDCWVVDRTMFEYVNQGGCSCCGVTHQIMDVASFASQCSDWESDDEQKEMFSPWPPFIHEEILTERARLRMVMKEDMKRYQSFVETHTKGFSAWWQDGGIDVSGKTRVFQVAEEDVMDYFRIHCKVKGSYEIVLCAVMEQIRHFKETGYKDGRIASELYFEQFLQNRHGCFYVDSSYITSSEGAANFCEMIRVLGGPKLLPVRQTKDSSENNQAEEEQAKSLVNVQSFRSDRRLLRLVILRKFVDIAIRKYLRDVASEPITSSNENQDE